MMRWRKGYSAAKEVTPATSDAELVLAARNGDKRAFVEIVSRHQAMVCGVALGVLADFAASEDAAQDAFLSAWRKIHELREPDRLRPWLAQIARNAALASLRRTRGHDSFDKALAVLDDGLNPDELVANEEEMALVREVLARLPETYRVPLVLFYREGQSVYDVSETLGISEDAVKQRLARGREMLRERMTGLVETVLTRTRPTAVFTIAIAAAIGALTSPTTVASAAFAGASTAAAGSSSQTLFTAMSASKTSIATVAIVAAAFQLATMLPHHGLRRRARFRIHRQLPRAQSRTPIDHRVLSRANSSRSGGSSTQFTEPLPKQCLRCTRRSAS